MTVKRARECGFRFESRLPARSTFDVVGFGLNSVDLVAVVAEYPASNSKQRLQRFARLPGGQIATALAACARLGWRSRATSAASATMISARCRARA